MDHSLQVTTTEAGREGMLSLAGNLTMAEAQETKKTLLEAIDQVELLRLDLAGVESVDVSLIQLLCAAHRECILSGKKILMQGNINAIMGDYLERAGYSKQCGCFSGAEQSCLWCTASIDN